jgi:hypothetical protein
MLAHAPTGARERPTLWLCAASVSMLLVVGLLFGAGKVAVRSAYRDHLNCGSVVKPLDMEVVGPPGTNPRPCEGSHDGDLGIALACLGASGLVIVAVVRSRPGRRGERTTEATTAA